MLSLLPDAALKELATKYLGSSSRSKLGAIIEQSHLNGVPPEFSVQLLPPKKEHITQANKPILRELLQQWHDWDLAKSAKDITIKRIRRGSSSISPANYPSKLIVRGFETLCKLLNDEITYLNFLTRSKKLMALLNDPSVEKHAAILKTTIVYIDISEKQFAKVIGVFPQIIFGMGEGLFLRQLPIEGVDTKFLESSRHASLLFNLYQIEHRESFNGGTITARNLPELLKVESLPTSGLRVRFSPNYQPQYANLPTVKLDYRDLMQMNILESNVLIVENETSVFQVRAFDDLLIIGGAGYSLEFLNAPWLKSRKLAYWGDMDSDGMNMMNQVLNVYPNTTVLMMNEQTYKRFEKEKVEDPNYGKFDHDFQNQYEYFLCKEAAGNRLEQEYISNDWVNESITQWLYS
tara:strand:- start:866 stop:2083 length:1218 start_codon:yes stop_codon:yes gene_type:complete